MEVCEVCSYRIEERGNGIKDAHIDAVREEQEDEVPVGHQVLQRLHEADLLRSGTFQELGCLLGGGWRSGWFVLENCQK